ncbi:unnamed protein product [Cochlearia groenlandica]
MGDTRGIAEGGNPQTMVGGDNDGCVSITILSPSFGGNLITTVQLTVASIGVVNSMLVAWIMNTIEPTLFNLDG